MRRISEEKRGEVGARGKRVRVENGVRIWIRIW